MANNWIHSFNVSESVKHKNGFTVFKITSIVFPRSMPEALSTITVWKRFSDVKKMYKDISKRHRDLHLPGNIPKLTETSFLRRFEPEVIEKRRTFILDLLNFVGNDPALYKLQAFVNFFMTSNSPESSPSKKGNIQAICSELAIPLKPEIVLIDPSRKECGSITEIEEVETSRRNSDMSSSTNSLGFCFINNDFICKEDSIESISSARSPHEALSVHTETDMPQFSVDNADYVFVAALEFSQAAEAEVSSCYTDAFDAYKRGIEILLNGSEKDTDAKRRRIAKEKAHKYLRRADEIYSNFIANRKEAHLHIYTQVLEINQNAKKRLDTTHLSNFKIVKILGEVLQVLNLVDKKIYVMKIIQKPTTHIVLQSMFLPQGIPYMTHLEGFIQTESKICLLLKLASGGKLWDYIKNYGCNAEKLELKKTLNEKKVELNKETHTLCDNLINNQTHDFDLGFLEMLSNYKKADANVYDVANLHTKLITSETVPLENSLQALNSKDVENIPFIDTLSVDIDVTDLVNSSQKLLTSVSSALEESNVLSVDHLKGPDFVKDVSFVRKVKPASKSKNEKRISVREKSISVEWDVFSVNKKSSLPEGVTKQWVCELVLSIENLHLNNILCCDLYPDNLLLGSAGKLVLTYFYRFDGLHATMQETVNPRAQVELYVAPERPFTKASDWWSVGVIIFELLTGHKFLFCHPGGVNCYYDVQFPTVQISEAAKSLIIGLLKHSPDDRLKVDEIKQHAFFEFVDWKEVELRGF